MKILITGATGFIGLRLVNSMLSLGHNVRVLVRDQAKAKRLLGEKCEIAIGDITDPNSLNGCCDGIDVVYQLVAQVGNELLSEATMVKFRKVNVEGLKNIIEEAKKAGVKRFISVSSIAAMGIVDDEIITEASECHPYLPYQLTKREGELLALKEYVDNAFPVIIVRPTKVYGIGERELTYEQIVKTCKRGLFPKVGMKDTMVSHCYIDDLINGLTLLSDKGKLGEIYIFTTERSIGFYESVKLVAKLIDKKVRFISVPRGVMLLAATIIERMCWIIGKIPPVTKRNVMAATTDRIYDISKAKNDLGFESKTTMEDGINKVLNYYKRENLI